MSTELIVYLIGCFFAFCIVCVEIIENEKMAKKYDEPNQSEYGLSLIVILFSWISVGAWVFGYFTNKNDE